MPSVSKKRNLKKKIVLTTALTAAAALGTAAYLSNKNAELDPKTLTIDQLKIEIKRIQDINDKISSKYTILYGLFANPTSGFSPKYHYDKSIIEKNNKYISKLHKELNIKEEQEQKAKEKEKEDLTLRIQLLENIIKEKEEQIIKLNLPYYLPGSIYTNWSGVENEENRKKEKDINDKINDIYKKIEELHKKRGDTFPGAF